MTGPIPLTYVLQDTLMAAGLGFLLAIGYRILRLLCGNTKIACAICDVVAFAMCAVFYRSACAGILAAGIPRWYTAAALCAGYGLCVRMLYAPFCAVQAAVRYTLSLPFVLLWRHCIEPLWQRFKAWRKKHKQAPKKKLHKKIPKTESKDLPTKHEVLYNSN